MTQFCFVKQRNKASNMQQKEQKTKFVDNYHSPIDQVSQIMIKCVKVGDKHNVYVAFHENDQGNLYCTEIAKINPKYLEVQFHGINVGTCTETVIGTETRTGTYPDKDQRIESLEFSSDPSSAPSHGYRTMLHTMETKFGFDVFADFMIDKFERSFAFNETNVWIHLMHRKAKDSCGLRFFALSDIIGENDKEKRHDLGYIDYDGKKNHCFVDHVTVLMIKHAHSMGLLDWTNDPSAWQPDIFR